MATGAELHQFGHDGRVRAVAFTADGARVATGSEDGTARVFDVATGAELGRVEHGGAVNCVAFNKEGTLLVAGSADRTARVWPVEPGQVLRQAEQRLTRNLYEREWRRYFPDTPYRKTQPDLP
jgi:WD40 repeat protein